MTPRRDANGLSAAHTKTRRLQRALLKQIAVHERDGTLPTSHRFLFYELEQLGVVSKVQTGARRVDQDLIDALTSLREVGLVPWDVIEDETRTLSSFQTAPTVVLYTLRAARRAALDRWDGRPAPLILCESRSLAGVLYDLAGRHACPIAATNGHSRGFLITKVAPALQPDHACCTSATGTIAATRSKIPLAQHLSSTATGTTTSCGSGSL